MAEMRSLEEQVKKRIKSFSSRKIPLPYNVDVFDGKKRKRAKGDGEKK